jgi:hypothetical protein
MQLKPGQPTPGVADFAAGVGSVEQLLPGLAMALQRIKPLEALKGAKKAADPATAETMKRSVLFGGVGAQGAPGYQKIPRQPMDETSILQLLQNILGLAD